MRVLALPLALGRCCALATAGHLSFSLRTPMPDRNDFKALHRVIRFISDLAVGSFFHELRVIGGENVPKTGPIIVCVVFCGAFLGVVGADGGGIGRRRTTT